MKIDIKKRLWTWILVLIFIFIIFEFYLIKKISVMEIDVKNAVREPVLMFGITSTLDQLLVILDNNYYRLNNINDIKIINDILRKNSLVESRFYRNLTMLFRKNRWPELKKILEKLVKAFSEYRVISTELGRSVINSSSGKNIQSDLRKKIIRVFLFIDRKLSELQNKIRSISDNSIQQINLSARNTYFLFFLTFVLFLFVSIFIPVYFGGIYLRKLKKLNMFTSEFANGNLSKRIPFEGEDEFTEVSNNLNVMADMLQEQMKKIEKKVMIRTKELENSNIKINKMKSDLEKKVVERTGELNEKIDKLNRSKKAMILMIEDLNRVTKDLKVAESELLKKERLATLGQISGNISHELRNPLGVIDSSIYYLRSKIGTKDKKAESHLKRIKNNIDASIKIIESLNDISRMKNPVLGKVGVKSIIEEVLKEIKFGKKVSIKKKGLLDEPKVIADREQLKIALRNILQNASDELDSEGNIGISMSMGENGMAVISISDDGGGIPGEYIKKIFEPLFTKKARGIGFGLSITKLIIENHGGKIEVKSKSGHGTEFLLFIPITDKGRIKKNNGAG